MADIQVGRDVFVMLATIVGADGKVERSEIEGLLHGAREQGLGDDDLRAIEEAATRGRAAAIEGARLSPADRLFVYAMAYWISRIDGEMSEDEDKALGKLGAELTLADDVRMAAEAAVDQVAALPEGDRPARFDIARLRTVLRVGL
jgi:uncharacterized tellurite resistance protein B-like protein